MFRLICLLLTIGCLDCHPSNGTQVRTIRAVKENPVQAYTVLGFELPQWMNTIRLKLAHGVGQVKKLFSGEEVSMSVFGNAVDIRAPNSVADLKTWYLKLYQRMQRSSYTRLMIAIYVNVGIVILINSILFIKNIQLTSRLAKDGRKKKELLAEDFQPIPVDDSVNSSPVAPTLPDRNESIIQAPSNHSSVQGSPAREPDSNNVVFRSTVMPINIPRVRRLSDLHMSLSPMPPIAPSAFSQVAEETNLDASSSPDVKTVPIEETKPDLNM